MCENKTQQMLIRMTPYDMGLLSYVSEQTHLSRAEILRLGLRLIARNIKPCEIDALKMLYNTPPEDQGGKNK